MSTRSTKPALRVVADDRPLEQFLTFRLSQLSSRLNRQATQLLSERSGLRLPEWRAIAVIARHRRLNAARIEELTGIDRGLLSRTLHALERKSLVVAERSVADRREVYFTLSSAGRQLHKRQLPLMRVRQQHLLAALDPLERKLVFRIVDKLLVAAAAGTRDFSEDGY